MGKINRQSLKETYNEHITLFSIIKGLVISFLITVPFFALLAFVLTYTRFPEKYISSSVIITTVISILIAGSTATRKVRNKGWLNGAAVGLIYMMTLYLLSSLVFKDFSVTRHTFTMLLIGVLSGSIGGILGINLRQSGRGRVKA
ncbi:MAG: TIGR04086 family membrane protein [Bacillota bacterium]|nr:TIGR04086 family membrane protein [Bacillota bacterium]